MDIQKLRARRNKLRERLSVIDAQIAKAEKAAREAEQRQLVKLVQSRGITAAELLQILDAAGNHAPGEKPQE